MRRPGRTRPPPIVDPFPSSPKRPILPQPPLVLASSSPRRLDLLRQIGVEPDRVVEPEIDESPVEGELPHRHAERLAGEKALAVAARLDLPAYVLAADTVVACGRRILPKAMDRETAARCLALLSGRRHRVHGGIAVRTPEGRLVTRLVTTQVRFKRLAARETAAYLASGEWQGKAGGYAIQGRAAAFIPWINGSWANVVGLPLVETLGLLEGLGWQVPA
jgi:septum formation protein